MAAVRRARRPAVSAPRGATPGAARRPSVPATIEALAVGLGILSALYGPVIIYVQCRQEKRNQERSRAALRLLLDRGPPPPPAPGTDGHSGPRP
ncbi:hypothetical protein ABZ714_10275 [Streptomyces sp. NPDC006798]|uniref:hypothetical protein n=1 Tax=Streptomyces sp. NPDC006798 TaxID=3155462 RepID=UPI0033E9240F